MMILRVKPKKVKKRKPPLVKGMTKYFLLALIIFGTAYITVKQRNSVTKMGYELGQLQRKNAEFDRERKTLESRFNELRQPGEILKQVEKFGLKLVRIEATQVITRPKPKPIDINNTEPSESDSEIKNKEESRLVRN